MMRKIGMLYLVSLKDYVFADCWAITHLTIGKNVYATIENINVANEYNVHDYFEIKKVQGGITIHSAKPVTVAIYNTLGQPVYQQSFINQQLVYLPRGIYIININQITRKIFID